MSMMNKSPEGDFPCKGDFQFKDIMKETEEPMKTGCATSTSSTGDMCAVKSAKLVLGSVYGKFLTGPLTGKTPHTSTHKL